MEFIVRLGLAPGWYDQQLSLVYRTSTLTRIIAHIPQRCELYPARRHSEYLGTRSRWWQLTGIRIESGPTTVLTGHIGFVPRCTDVVRKCLAFPINAFLSKFQISVYTHELPPPTHTPNFTDSCRHLTTSDVGIQQIAVCVLDNFPQAGTKSANKSLVSNIKLRFQQSIYKSLSHISSRVVTC